MLNNLKDTNELVDFFGFRPILSASVKVTRNCNLNCKHCYVDINNGQLNMPLSQVKKIIDDFAANGGLNLFINGGEPFIREDICEIFKYAYSKSLMVSVSSNGLKINKEILEKIKSPNLKLFQISIDGNKEIHNKIRGNEKSYESAIRALKLAKEILSKTQVVMATTIMKDNLDDICNMLKLAKECKVDTYCVVPLMPSSEHKYDQEEIITAKQKHNVIEELTSKYLENYEDDFELSIVVPPALIPDKIRDKKFGKGYLCTFPEMLGIDSNGKVAPCDGLLDNEEFELGNLTSEKISDVIDNKIIKQLENIDYNDLVGVCSICKFSKICQGGCRVSSYNKYGNFLCPDSICQEMYEEGYFPESSIDKEKEYKEIIKE